MKSDLRIFYLVCLLGIVSVFSWSQTTDSPAPAIPADSSAAGASTSAFGLGVGIGYVSMPSGGSNSLIGWQKIGFTPDIAIDKFGIGLDINIHFRFNGGIDGNSFEIRPEDWVVSSFLNFLEVYLPKIQYIRYGVKGEPVYLLLGSVYSGFMGNGFLVNGYNNTLYQPKQRIFGANFDLDGAAFDFPYIGIESMLANFAAFDIIAGRFYVRPGAKSDSPILAGMQIGASIAVDTNPHYYSPDPSIKANPSQDTVLAWGVDLQVPIISGDVYSLIFLGDMAFQKANVGGQIGLGGKLFSFLNYIAAVRYVGDNFIPSYFDSSYDLMREEKLKVYSSTTIISPAYAGWLVNLGCSFVNNALVFNLGLDGPFVVDHSVPTKNPNMKISLTLKEGLLEGLSLQAVYDKHVIRQIEDLISPVNAKISLVAGYKMGPAKISLIYDIRYDPYMQSAGSSQPWQVSSKLETSIDLF